MPQFNKQPLLDDALQGILKRLAALESAAAARSGLGHFAALTGFSGAFGTGGATLTSHTITIANPSGATVRWRFGASGYASAIGVKANYMVNTDGLGWTNLGVGLYFNVASSHAWLGTGAFENFLTSGLHTLYVGIYTNTGTITMDANDFYMFEAQELP